MATPGWEKYTPVRDGKFSGRYVERIPRICLLVVDIESIKESVY